MTELRNIIFFRKRCRRRLYLLLCVKSTSSTMRTDFLYTDCAHKSLCGACMHKLSVQEIKIAEFKQDPSA